MSPIALLSRILEYAEGGHRRACALLLLLGLALYLPGQTTLQPMDRDEPRFAQATKQMLETGDFIDIRFQDEARHKKPVGIYWLQSVAVSAGEALGVEDARRNVALYRIPSLAGALATMLLTYAAACAFLSRRGAFMAAVLMGSTILLGVEARLAKTDAVLAATVVGSMAALARAWFRRDDDPPLPTVWRIAFWVALGFGILVKGPIAPAIVGLAALWLSIARRSGRWLQVLGPGLGAVIVALIVLPWFAAIAIKSGGAFFEASLGDDMLAKVGQSKERHGAPPGTYLGVFFGTAWPLVPFFLISLPFVWTKRRDPAVLFCIAWVVPMWLIFEAVRTKLPHYVMPLYPALAILAALAVERGAAIHRGRAAGILVWWLALPPVILAGAAFFGALHLGDAPPWIGVPVLLLALPAGVMAARLLRQGHAEQAALTSACASIVIAFGAYLFTAPALRSLHVSERLAEAARSVACTDPVLASAGYSEPSLVLLTQTDIEMTDGRGAAEILAGSGCRIVFVERRHVEAFERAVSAAGLSPRLVTRITGFNINGGRRLDIAVLSREGAR